MTAPKGGRSRLRSGRPNVDAPGQFPRRRVLRLHYVQCAVALLGVILAGALFDLSIPTTQSAGATTISTLKGQAEAIANEIANDNARLGSISSTYIEEHATYVAANAKAALIKLRIEADQRLIVRDRRQVQQAVVTAYVTGNNGSTPLASWSSNPNTQISSTTYLGVAADHLTDVITQFQTDQRSLHGSLTTELRTITQAATAFASTASARESVLATVQNEQHLYTSTNAQLNTLVAAAAAKALAAQERAAVVAAAAAAAKAAAAGPPSAAGLASVATGTPSPISTGSAQSGNLAAQFAAIRNCESSDDYTLNTGNGYYGAYQFALATWQNLGQSGIPSDAPPSTQDAAAYLLYQRAGDSFSSWPTCAAIAGLN